MGSVFNSQDPVALLYRLSMIFYTDI